MKISAVGSAHCACECWSRARRTVALAVAPASISSLDAAATSGVTAVGGQQSASRSVSKAATIDALDGAHRMCKCEAANLGCRACRQQQPLSWM